MLSGRLVSHRFFVQTPQFVSVEGKILAVQLRNVKGSFNFGAKIQLSCEKSSMPTIPSMSSLNMIADFTREALDSS